MNVSGRTRIRDCSRCVQHIKVVFCRRACRRCSARKVFADLALTASRFGTKAPVVSAGREQRAIAPRSESRGTGDGEGGVSFQRGRPSQLCSAPPGGGASLQNSARKYSLCWTASLRRCSTKNEVCWDECCFILLFAEWPGIETTAE